MINVSLWNVVEENYWLPWSVKKHEVDELNYSWYVHFLERSLEIVVASSNLWISQENNDLV